jgi:YHS domain-containing protein
MTAKNHGKLMRWLACGSAAAGLSAALISIPSAEAGLWFRPQRESGTKPLTAPRALSPATTSIAKPLQLGEDVIQPVAGRRRAKRQQAQEQSQPPKEPTAARADAAPAPVAAAAPVPIAAPARITAPVAAAPQPAVVPQPAAEEDGFFLEEEMPEPPDASAAARPQPEFEFAQPAPEAQPVTEIPDEQLSPIQRELKRLYEQNGYQAPPMADTTAGSRQPASGQPRTQRPAQAAPQAIPQPGPQVKAAPALQSSQPAPASVAAPPAAAAVEAEPDVQAEVAAPKRKGILGLFRFRKSESEVAQPPQEPRHYVPENQAPVELQPVEDLGVEEIETSEDDSSDTLNPLRARNYQNELFGPPRASDEAEEEVFVPENPDETALQAEPGLGDESSSDHSLSAPADESPESTATEPGQDPFTGLRLNDAEYGSDAGAAPPLPPEGPFAEASSNTPRKTIAPALRPATRQEASLGRSVSMKRERIAARVGQPGLKGFCPVRLRDDRELEDGASQFQTTYEGKTYHLSSAEALTKFLSNPSRYAPSERGVDVVEQAKSGAKVEGTLDHSVWYKGQLYLFATTEALQSFVASPAFYASKN